MRAIKSIRKFIESNPDDADALLLSKLVVALESEGEFAISDLYQLGLERFELALQLLHDWRLDRYYSGKVRLFDISWQATQAPAPAPAAIN